MCIGAQLVLRVLIRTSRLRETSPPVYLVQTSTRHHRQAAPVTASVSVGGATGATQDTPAQVTLLRYTR